MKNKKLLLLLPLLLTSCSIKRYSPLQYCLWEIQSNEGYEEFSYFYNELTNNELQEEADEGCSLYAYYITTFTEDVKGEWFCIIECRQVGYKTYTPDEVVLIDCDLAFEMVYGSYGEEGIEEF